MQAGKLNRVITIEREIATINKFGYKESTWTTVGTVRAEVAQHAIDEAATGYGEGDTDAITVRTRYFAGLSTADRIRFFGRVYGVKGFTELGIRAGLEIRAEVIA
jgi:head-tail adaptor